MFIIGMMQLIGAIVTEGMNIYMICSKNKIDEIVQNFVQFGIICQIDDLYAQSLKNSFFMKVLLESEIDIHSTEEEKKRSLECNTNPFLTFVHNTGKIVHWGIKTLYSSFYFYFAPYSVIVFSVYNLDYSKDASKI